MSTERLYHEDPFLLRFDARLVRRAEWKGNASIVLDRTAFYPEGGGQLSDLGVIRVGALQLQVRDIQIDDDDDIHHLVDEEVGEELVDQTVEGEVDVRRRRDHMSQHTAQHMLSRALLEVADAETVSSRLGSQLSTIDLKVAGLTPAQIAQAENLVNELVSDDRAVRSLFPTPDELLRLPLRRPPKVDRNVRVIEIVGFDHSPCGGTHCTRTSQVGPVHVLGVEKYKGLLRLTFVSGRRCLQDYLSKDAVLRGLAHTFTCGLLEVPAAVGRLRDEAATQGEQLKWLRDRYAQATAVKWLQSSPVDVSGTTHIVAEHERTELANLRALAGAIASRPDVVAIVGSRDATGGWQVVVERGAEARFDAGRWLKDLAASLGAKAGGRPERAEGKLPGSVQWSRSGLGLG